MKLRSQSSLRLLLAGVGIGVLGVVLMGQMPVDIRDLVRVEFGPHPRDMVQIQEGTPYVVPAGKLFVLTALGTTHKDYTSAQMFVNGQREMWQLTPSGGSNGLVSVQPVPSGFTVPAGSTIELQNGVDEARAWGQCH